MNAITEAGKWTCGTCGRTVTVYASEADTACCIRALQDRHARAHQAAQHMQMPASRKG